jgi:hypothetical protein
MEVILYDSNYRSVASLGKLFALARLAAYALICVKLLWDVWERRFDFKDYIIIVAAGMLLLLTARHSGKKDYLLYWAFIAAAHDVDYRKIIRYSLIVHLLAMAVIFGGCLLHVIPNSVNIRGDGTARYSLGFFYGGLLAHFTLYTILMWIYVRAKAVRNWELLVMLGLNVSIYAATDTRSPFALGCIAIIGSFVLKYCNMNKFIHNCCRVISVGMVPVVVASVLGISYQYDSSVNWMAWINRLVNGRFQLGHNAIFTYGISAFGQKIEWSVGKGYNYVDSSFLKMLLDQGIVFFLVIVSVIVILKITAAKKNDIYLLWVLFIVVVHAAFDDQLLWIGCNSFMMCYSYIKGKYETQ